MTKKEWLGMRTGDMAWNPDYGTYRILSVDQETGNLDTYTQNGRLSSNNAQVIPQMNSVNLSALARSTGDKPWLKFIHLPIKEIKKYTFGKLVGSGEQVFVTETCTLEDTDLHVMDAANNKHVIPKILFIEDWSKISGFPLLNFRAKSEGIMDNILKDSPRETPEPFTIKSCNYVEASYVSKQHHRSLFVTLEKRFRTIFSLRHGCESVVYLIFKSYHSAQYVSIDEIESIIYKPKDTLKSGQLAMYRGKDFTKLKNGAICTVKTIKPDYASSKFDIVTIVNKANNFETRVFAGKLKRIK